MSDILIEKLAQLIMANKSPKTIAEAVDLYNTIYNTEILQLLSQIKTKLIKTLPEKEQTQFLKLFEPVEEVSTFCSLFRVFPKNTKS